MNSINKYSNEKSDSDKKLLAVDYYHQGVEHGLRGNEAAAIEAFSRAIQSDPYFKEAYFNRGNAYYRFNKLNEAIEDFNKAIEIDPNFAGAIYNRGATKLVLMDVSGAKNDFIKASKLGELNAKNALLELEKRDMKINLLVDQLMSTIPRTTNIEYVERIPENILADKLIEYVYTEVHSRFNLTNVFPGYIVIPDDFAEEGKKSIFGNVINLGHSSTMGFDLEYIARLKNEFKNLYLYYLAIPIDDDDYIIENDMEVFDFTEELESIVKREVSTIGALSFKEFKRCKTFKWIDGWTDEVNFKPDYRDTILYNGYLPYRANGNFMGDLIEFERYNNPEKKILFNTNLTKPAYINNHDKFDLVRNRDGKSFSTFQITMAQGTFVPTGRTYLNETHGIMWENMKLDDPSKTIYMKLPLNENFITGKKCLEIVLK